MSNIFPANGPPRVFRYVEPGTLPATNLVCLFDKTKNLLIIDRERFSELSALHQQIVLTTNEPYIEVSIRAPVFA